MENNKKKEKHTPDKSGLRVIVIQKQAKDVEEKSNNTGKETENGKKREKRGRQANIVIANGLAES